MLSKILAAAVLLGAAHAASKDKDDVHLKSFTTGTLSPGFALENGDDVGGLCLRLERSFEVESVNANDQCTMQAAVEGTERALRGEGWQIVKEDDDTVSIVNKNSKETGASVFQLKVDMDDDDDLKFALGIEGYQFAGGSTTNSYVLELSVGACSEKAIDDASSENKHSDSKSTSASTSTSTSTSSSTTSSSNDTSSDTTSSSVDSSSEASSYDSSSREIRSNMSPSSINNIRDFLRSIRTTRICTVNGDDDSDELKNVVCVASSNSRYRFIVPNFQNCSILQVPDHALAVDGVLSELAVRNSASSVGALLAVFISVAAYIVF